MIAPLAISNHGALLHLSPAVRQAMVRRHRSPHVYVLGTRNGTTIFCFGDSGRCFGAKRDFSVAEMTPQSVPFVFGGVFCTARASPMIDFSVYGANRGQTIHLLRLQGVATDRVRVYALAHVPRGVVSVRPVLR